jgi:hypothetical protein
MAERWCQYKGMLVRAVMAMKLCGHPGGWEVARSWMEKDGVKSWKQREESEWLCAGREWEDMEDAEMSQMARVFYMMAGKNADLARRKDRSEADTQL